MTITKQIKFYGLVLYDVLPKADSNLVMNRSL